jgi:DivIVA domain-containing protein
MALDRLSVTRTDFPMSRRGYDRIAVDRHLEEIAREVESLQVPRPASVGATASAQVQSILDAAEASAAEIERRAWEEATQVEAAADEALARARGQVTALSGAAHALRDRIESLLAEVGALESHLGGLEEDVAAPVGDPQDTVAFEPILEEELEEQPEPAPEAGPREARFGRDEADHRTGWFAAGPPAWNGTTATRAAVSQEARESARLVALNMADGGQPREAADQYLAQLFSPEERAALLDEIYGGR